MSEREAGRVIPAGSERGPSGPAPQAPGADVVSEREAGRVIPAGSERGPSGPAPQAPGADVVSEELDVRVPPLRRWWLDPVAGPVASLAAVVTRGDPPRVFTTLARHPRLFRRWLVFASSFLVRSELPRADVELVVLRTAWACRSRYEWAQHVSLAGGAGLPPATIARIPDGPDGEGWTPRQALLLRAVDELHDHRVVTDATWTALAAVLSERQLIELCFLVGHYEMLAMTLNSLGVEPEPSALNRLAGTVSDAAESLHRKIGAARRVVADTDEEPRTGEGAQPATRGGRDGRLA